MNAPISKVDVVILAAGQGKRMHQAFPGVPKVLVPLHGRPMLLHVLDAVDASGIAARVTVVVGPAVEKKVRAALAGRDVRFVLQPEPKGTGHAVLCARPAVSKADHVLVLYGDQPLISSATIHGVTQHHVSTGADMTMLTVPLPDFSGWRSSFADWGRIVRDSGSGRVVKSVEAKDASATELRITEVNPSFYCFRAPWLWEHLPQVGCDNVQGEYYLPDVLGIAVAQKAKLETVAAHDSRETLGANTPEQLAVLERTYNELRA
ncbi:hypothetical protein EPO33_03915 [Patescibacteria group bacterium]|nr:MAG: hypothetical protein EPO33_03915 [Patescibacteria group bacterium]